MPPKKKGKQDKAGQGQQANPFEGKIKEMEAIDDGTGIPKNACTFNIEFEIEHIDIEDYLIQMNFISSDKPEEMQIIKTPLIDSWEEKEDENQEDKEGQPKQ